MMKRSDMLMRLAQMKVERESWIAEYKEITAFLLPRSGRYFRSDRNKGGRKSGSILDDTATSSLRTLSAGMMSMVTSPARPWFRLGTGDPDLNSYFPVKLWLDDVTKRMQLVFNKSNTYRAFHQMYEELGAFGTAVSIVLPDFKNVIHHYPVTAGEYCIATDYQGRVNTLYREFEKTVAELVSEFGYERCSKSVQEMWRRGNLGAWVPIVHAIEPRSDRDHTKHDSKNMAYSSCHFELNGHDDQSLRESGYRNFPALVPRWNLSGGDVYGSGPASDALGGIKQLQHEQLRKGQVIDYQTNPPLQIPTSLKGREVDRLPGGTIYVDNDKSVRTAFDVSLNLGDLLQDMQDVRQRIRVPFHTDLFLMLANSTDSRKTATEIAERHEEKLQMLGPVSQRLDGEMLRPTIEMTFGYMVEAGIVPPAPPELQGMELAVEFVSVMAQAQRAIGVNSTDRFVGNLVALSASKPDILDKFDSDYWADSYSDITGVDPRLLVSDKQVAAIRTARNNALAAKEQAAAIQQQSMTAKNLSQSQTGLDGQNALMDVMNQFSGYSSPSPTQV